MNLKKILNYSILLYSIMSICSYAEIHYVSLTGNAISPYTNWADASTNIQYAINIATSNETVLVTNGEYYLTAQLGFTNKYINFLSINGPSNTFLYRHSTTNIRLMYLTNSMSFVSGFTIASGLITAVNGYGGGIYIPTINRGAVFQNTFSNCIIRNNIISGTSASGGAGAGGNYISCQFLNNFATNNPGYGGALYCGDATNSYFANNRSYTAGGGVYCGIFNNCVFESNICNGAVAPQVYLGYGNRGGGASFSSTINNSRIFYNGLVNVCDGGGVQSSWVYNSRLFGNTALYGGGACASFLQNCIIESNRSASSGGGALNCNLINCLIITNYSNAANNDGGGASVIAGGGGTNINCTFFGNWCTRAGGATFGNSASYPMYNFNCVIVSNQGASGNELSGSTNSYCLNPRSLLAGTDNIQANPNFADTIYFRLKSTFGTWSDTLQTWIQYPINSPCLDAGDPTSSYANEPLPNGNRINMGYDGNTPQSSKSLTGIWKYTDSFQSPTKILVPMK